MSKLKEIQGLRFGKLTVIKKSNVLEEKESQNTYWVCKCDCGKEKEIKYTSLLNKKRGTKSCGCLSKNALYVGRTKHSYTVKNNENIAYSVWESVKQRCLNPKNDRYHDYGGRGISICSEWINSFPQFLSDMGERPSKDFSIERDDVNGDYCPSNCRWATREEQMNNKRDNVFITFEGKTQTLMQWARELNIQYNTLRFRILRGWSIERAIITPVKSKN